MMKISLQWQTEFSDEQFDLECGIRTASGKWNNEGAERFLNGVPEIGTKRLGKAYPWQQLKCGERRWILLGEGESQFRNVTHQLESVAVMPPRCQEIDGLRQDLKESIWRLIWVKKTIHHQHHCLRQSLNRPVPTIQHLAMLTTPNEKMTTQVPFSSSI